MRLEGGVTEQVREELPHRPAQAHTRRVTCARSQRRLATSKVTDTGRLAIARRYQINIVCSLSRNGALAGARVSYKGMFPCFFGGFRSRLFSSVASA